MPESDRRSFLRALGAGALGSVRSAAARRKPNLVLILADDLGYGDLSCYGNHYNRTSHLDELASGGVRFTDFHSSGAVCSPTRAGLMTGRYQQRCGIGEVLTAANHRHLGLDPGETTWARLLKNAGYRTAIFGKWHLGYEPKFNPVKHGFDEFRGYVSGNVDYVSHIDQTGRADWWHNTELVREEGYTTELVTRHGVRFIEENKDRPFCLYLAHEAVHYPYQGPGDPPQRREGTPGGRGSRDNVRPVYRRMLEAMDEGIGRVVSTIRRLELERDTFVFFFSDNGATQAGSNGPLRGAKASVWEGGHRVPAIAWWPGTIPAGRVSYETAICLDLFPTLLEIAEAPPAGRDLDGASLLDHLTKGARLPDRMLFWAHGPQRAVRRGRWKLVLTPGQEPFLADLRADLAEKTNLAPARPELVREMRDALARWEKDVSAGAA